VRCKTTCDYPRWLRVNFAFSCDVWWQFTIWSWQNTSRTNLVETSIKIGSINRLRAAVRCIVWLRTIGYDREYVLPVYAYTKNSIRIIHTALERKGQFVRIKGQNINNLKNRSTDLRWNRHFVHITTRWTRQWQPNVGNHAWARCAIVHDYPTASHMQQLLYKLTDRANVASYEYVTWVFTVTLHEVRRVGAPIVSTLRDFAPCEVLNCN